jgi:hypothetical protein
VIPYIPFTIDSDLIGIYASPLSVEEMSRTRQNDPTVLFIIWEMASIVVYLFWLGFKE